MNIIERRRRDDTSEFAIVKRDHPHHPYVSVVISEESLKHGEWFWGHYFKTLSEAVHHYENR